MIAKRVFYLLIIAIVAGASALAGLVGGGLLFYNYYRSDGAQPAAATATASTPSTTQLTGSKPASQSVFVNNVDIETTITDVIKKAGPAVVTVGGEVQYQMSPFGGASTGEVSGSGFFISEDGYLLTSNHVVEDTTDLWITLADGTRQDVTLVGSDKYADLAVLKTDGPVPAYLTLGNSDALDPGETVIAIGSPLGDFMNSVTVGVVSATGRSVDTGNGYQIEDMIQTDAAINSGNSGGPLVNLAGDVVGINTLVVRGSQTGASAEGLGFAVSSNSISGIAEQIMETGSFARPNLGIQFEPINPDIASRYSLPVEYGAYITAVAGGSAAEKAGLQEGDIITAVGSVQLDETNAFLNALYHYQPGDQVSITFVRDGSQQQVQAVLGEAKSS